MNALLVEALKLNILKILLKLEEDNMESNNRNDWPKWHDEEGDDRVFPGTREWSLAEKYKRHHPDYAKDNVYISHVWIDKDSQLCVMYEDAYGNKLNWFHYLVQNNCVTWW